MKFDKDQKFLPLNIYRSLSKSVYPFKRNITDFVSHIYIPCDEGHIKLEEIITARETIFVTEQRGPEYWCVKPIFKVEGRIGPMAGGNLAYSSDSRCKRVYHVHDRFETPQEHKTLST